MKKSFLLKILYCKTWAVFLFLGWPVLGLADPGEISMSSVVQAGSKQNQAKKNSTLVSEEKRKVDLGHMSEEDLNALSDQVGQALEKGHEKNRTHQTKSDVKKNKEKAAPESSKISQWFVQGLNFLSPAPSYVQPYTQKDVAHHDPKNTYSEGYEYGKELDQKTTSLDDAQENTAIVVGHAQKFKKSAETGGEKATEAALNTLGQRVDQGIKKGQENNWGVKESDPAWMKKAQRAQKDKE